MNWKKGLFRLWVIGTVLWVGAVAWFQYPAWKDEWEQISGAKKSPDYWRQSCSDSSTCSIGELMKGLCPRPPPTGEEVEKCAESQALLESAIEDYRNSINRGADSHEIALVIATQVEALLGPPIAMVALGWLIGFAGRWVARGFRLARRKPDISN